MVDVLSVMKGPLGIVLFLVVMVVLAGLTIAAAISGALTAAAVTGASLLTLVILIAILSKI